MIKELVFLVRTLLNSPNRCKLFEMVLLFPVIRSYHVMFKREFEEEKIGSIDSLHLPIKLR